MYNFMFDQLLLLNVSRKNAVSRLISTITAIIINLVSMIYTVYRFLMHAVSSHTRFIYRMWWYWRRCVYAIDSICIYPLHTACINMLSFFLLLRVFLLLCFFLFWDEKKNVNWCRYFWATLLVGDPTRFIVHHCWYT